MPLDAVVSKLSLYKSEDITSPKGIGARVYSDLVKEKIGRVIERKNKGVKVRTGILVANPDSDQETQHPIAIICEFARQITEDVLSFTHQLCWNFCRAPLLIVIEPTLVRAFSCYESPIPQNQSVDNRSKSRVKQTSARNQPSFLDNIDGNLFRHPTPIKEFEINNDGQVSDESKAAIESLQWIELVSGNFFKKEKKYFPREQRADKTLLDNLQYIRERLHKDGLKHDTIHALLARLIFIQFLFQREDSKGQSAISSDYLKKLYEEQELSRLHTNLSDILLNYTDAYKFFRLLNDRFNGDLFPGKKERAWQEEKDEVKKEHLKMLADFISGDLDQQTGQQFLWKRYSFDIIPLEFISSIYEEFVSQDQLAEREEKKQNKKKRRTGVYYTKSHLVDFILDNVLPWKGDKYDLKILDPSCGSGIFLVKAFQRLVWRWKEQKSKPNRKYNSKALVKHLTHLLENNLFGVDVDPAAVRVTSFSLYLAMCDEIDPRTLWEEASFPNLRDKRVVARDFFDDDANNPLFKEEPDRKYDLIIGNAPWGRDTLDESKFAKTWMKNTGWESSYKNIGPLFLPKAASVLKEDGYISLIQPTLPLLAGQSGKAERFREQLFRKYKIEEVVNLSDLSSVLFNDAKFSVCVVTMRSTLPDGKSISYICPKKRGTDEDLRQITIEPMNVSSVQLDEAINKPWIWTVLMWGSRRDVLLIERLRSKNTVAKMILENKALTRQGIIRGDRKAKNKDLDGKHILLDNNFPENTFLTLESDKLPVNEDIRFHSKDSSGENSFDSFEYPQIFVKNSWKKDSWRFSARFIESLSKTGVLCSRDYLNIHSKQILFLKSATLVFNSSFAAYFLLLMDGRFAFDRPNPLVDSFWQIPIPEISEEHFEKLKVIGKTYKAGTLSNLDEIVLNALKISESEKILINDLFYYTLPDFKEKENSISRQITVRKTESELEEYCEIFIKVIKASFGQDKEVRATIFQEDGNKRLPVRMIAIHLDFPQRDEQIKKDICKDETLWERLEKLNETFMQSESASGNIFYQRVVRIYDNFEFEGEQIPTVYLIKPDQKRYWLGSQALNDADEVAADLVHWFQQQNQIHSQGEKLKKVA